MAERTPPPDPGGATPGQRIKAFRERAGMSRPVLAARVERSPQWLKAVESGRLMTPRLPMLLRLAQELGVSDLTEITGDSGIPVRVFAGEAHSALTSVRAALTEYRIPPSAPAPDLRHLDARLGAAWRVRHSSPNHRTQLGALLPGLIRDAQTAVRSLTDAQKRQARRILGGVYQLADFYVAYQPSPELVWLVADRAVTEGQEADDPYTLAAGSWALVQALRDSGRWDEATDVAVHAAAGVGPYVDTAPDDWRGIWGALHAELALTAAARGRSGDAWRYLDAATNVLRHLPTDYRHIQTSFSAPIVRAHATTLGVDLRRPAEALRAADFEPDDIASVPRRARHLIEVARAHDQRGERHATLALLTAANRTAPETARYNTFARTLTLDLVDRPPTGVRREARALATNLGLLAG
jgi:transcriptional regulator with XRE-family HTH domain